MKPLRILQIVTSMERAGLETMLMRYYRHMDLERVQFDFLTHRLQRSAYADEIERMGGRIFTVAPIAPRTLTENHRQTKEFFADHPEYIAVHAHMDALSSLPLAAAKAAGVPVRIAHSHTAGFDRDGKYPLRLITRAAIPQYATHYMACSVHAGRFMFGRHFDGHVCHNAVETDAYRYSPHKRQSVREALGEKPDSTILGYVGRLEPVKNPLFMLDVLSVARKRVPDLQLWIVGDGSMRTALLKRASALGLSQCVRVWGMRDDVADLMQGMDALIMPSHYEGLGMAAIEAQASGLAVLASTGVPEEAVITPLMHRIALSEGAKAWADAVCDALSEKRENTALAVYDAGYDIGEQAARLQDFYLHVTNEVRH